MLWILLAILSHSVNALVFVVDKSLLGQGGRVGRPVWYAAYSGMLAASAASLLALSFKAPNFFIAQWSLIAGVAWVVALWLFFGALKMGEPSRVVPIAGSAVPVFTWLLAMAFLGEKLVAEQMLAVVFLIVGGSLLAVELDSVRSVRAAGVAVLSGAAFAVYFAVMKHVYDNFDSFLAAFAYSRLGVGVVGMGLLLVLFTLERPVARKPEKKNLVITGVFLGNKIMGMVGLLLQNWAIALGSVTVVNALQGVQYVAVLLMAWLVSVKWSWLFKEEMNRVARGQKVAGIILISVGLVWLLLGEGYELVG